MSPGGDRGRRERGEGVKVQREEANKVVFQENKVRGSEIECREETQNEREVCEEGFFCSTYFSFARQIKLAGQHLLLICH